MEPVVLTPDELSEIESLEKEIAAFTAQKEACAARVKELLAAEDMDKGVFHSQEIFAQGQEKLRLETEIQIKQKKINRIRLGIKDLDAG